jgi:sortase (surface protein transpeptidase)
MTSPFSGKPAGGQRGSAPAGRSKAFWATIVGSAVVIIAGAVIGIVALRGSSTPTGEPVTFPKDVTTAVPTPATGPRPAPLARSVPVQIRIPAIAVNAPVTELGLDADGAIQVPPLNQHNLAGWYEYGPTPGQQGPAVIVGHVDSYTGPSVFYRLKDLRKGERIYVTLADGQRPAFIVDGLQEASKDQFPTSAVYGSLPYQGLRLITCGGPFDTGTGHYLDNVIVYAHRTGSGTASSA